MANSHRVPSPCAVLKNQEHFGIGVLDEREDCAVAFRAFVVAQERFGQQAGEGNGDAAKGRQRGRSYIFAAISGSRRGLWGYNDRHELSARFRHGVEAFQPRLATPGAPGAQTA